MYEHCHSYQVLQSYFEGSVTNVSCIYALEVRFAIPFLGIIQQPHSYLQDSLSAAQSITSVPGVR